ncbi:MAG TPA: alpha/beta family hydrolase [Dehalococcoidia bacterium]|nr:alpha/beta family hydrolase [Dehalococcoidia bacterium]
MGEEALRLTLADGRSVAALRTPAEGAAAWLFLYAPGASGNVHDPFGAYAARELSPHGVTTVRFQFPYAEAGRRTPDPPAVLEATWRAAIEAYRSPGAKLVAGGRSMGGRIASRVVAQGTAVDALALFAYPLHPPGRPERTRDEHLPLIGVPTLFCSGTNDAFASEEELRAAAAKVPRATLHFLDGADHGFAPPRGSGRTRPDVWREAVSALVAWLERMGTPPR